MGLHTMPLMKALKLMRHAARAKDADALSPEGRVQAEEAGRVLPTDYAMVFVSPAKRAAETVAWLLRGSGRRLPSHAVVRGLASDEEDRWRAAAKAAGSPRLDTVMATDPELVMREAQRLADVAEGLFARIPEGGAALAVGHSPLIEAAVYGLTGVIIEPVAECEGPTIIREEDGEYRIGEQ
jgi:broad specificity phosphatase PhoE